MITLFKSTAVRATLVLTAVLGVTAVGTAGAAGPEIELASAKSRPKIVKSEIYYETYIPRGGSIAPQDYIDTPDVGCHNLGKDGKKKADWWNRTDNRTGPAFKSGQFRTQVVLSFDFKKKKWGERHKINPTKRYAKVGGKFVYEDQRTDSDAGIRVEGEPKVGSAQGGIAVSHSSANPWCSGFSAIDWTIVMTVHRDGRTEVVGSHDKMPNHEMWREDTYSNGKKTHKMIFSHRLVSPTCLIDYVGEAVCKGLTHYKIPR